MPQAPGSAVRFAGVSPDGRMLALYWSRPDGVGVELIIGKVETSSWFVALQSLEDPLPIEWLPQNRIVIYEAPRGASWPVTWAMLDLSTRGVEPLPRLLLEWAHAFSPDGRQLLYVGLSEDASRRRTLRLIDLATGRDTSVAPWLDLDTLEAPSDLSMRWSEGGISVAALDGRRVIYWSDMDTAALLRPDLEPTRISFPQPADQRAFLWWSQDGELLAVGRAPEGHDLEFWVLDTERGALLQYCLAPEIVPNLAVGSPDGKFLAWVAKIDSQEGTVVLDLANGWRSWLPGWRVISWATVEN